MTLVRGAVCQTSIIVAVKFYGDKHDGLELGFCRKYNQNSGNNITLLNICIRSIQGTNYTEIVKLFSSFLNGMRVIVINATMWTLKN